MVKPLRNDDSQREDHDLALISRLTRDICFLYHQLASYGFILGDLDYSSHYDFEYWCLLNSIAPGMPDGRFIRGGIWVLTLAMLQDVFDGSGDCISIKRTRIKEALAAFVPEDEDMMMIVSAVEHGLELLETKSLADARFEADVSWAYDAFVRTYFKASAL